MSNQEIATTIISQFGRSFPQMVGLKDAVAIERGVQFGIAKADQGINKVVITLNAMDTYDLHRLRAFASDTRRKRPLVANLA